MKQRSFTLTIKSLARAEYFDICLKPRSASSRHNVCSNAGTREYKWRQPLRQDSPYAPIRSSSSSDVAIASNCPILRADLNAIQPTRLPSFSKTHSCPVLLSLLAFHCVKVIPSTLRIKVGTHFS